MVVSVTTQLEELGLIRSSLLPGEHIHYLDLNSSEAKKWRALVNERAMGVVPPTTEPQGDEDLPLVLSPARFRVCLEGATVWFDINLQGYNGDDYGTVSHCVTIGGENLSRTVHEWWRERIKEKVEEVAVAGGEFLMYQLLSLHLLPLLREETERVVDAVGLSSTHETGSPIPKLDRIYHVLFTSHHLISPTKRRNLQQWSSSLKIPGFAKVGYPGVIYAQGPQGDIQEFVDNIKAMQWLALKLRFVEPLKDDHGDSGETGEVLRGWKEFEKIGQVVEQMRKLGRGKYVCELGIGAGAKET